MIKCLQDHIPSIDLMSALSLEIQADEEMELPLVWLLSTVFLSIWTLRISKSKVQLYEVRAQLEAKVNLLRETRFKTSASLLDLLVAKYF